MGQWREGRDDKGDGPVFQVDWRESATVPDHDVSQQFCRKKEGEHSELHYGVCYEEAKHECGGLSNQQNVVAGKRISYPPQPQEDETV